MRPYEVMVIFDPDLDDGDIRTSLEKATDACTSNGGVVNRVDHWGRRTLAYEIQHKKSGYYALVELTAPIDAVSAMDRVLRLDDPVIRHKVVRIPDHIAGRAPAEVEAAVAETAAEQGS